jgi:glycosyltransferase involved in cell wall biosynthesis
VNILFFPMGSVTVPSSRYRLYQYLPLLSNYGIRYKICSSELPSCSRLVFAIKLCCYLLWADIVFIQKNIPTSRIRKLIRFLNKNIVFDFDDAIWTLNTSKQIDDNTKQNDNLRGLLGDFLKNYSKAVIVGNEFLSEFAELYNHNIFILPTAVDTDTWKRVEHKTRKEIIIGWIGTKDNLFFLEKLQHVFIRIHDKYKDNVLLKIICDLPFKSNLPMEIINAEWSLGSEIKELSECDIGIMPLVDDEWTRGKCGFKLIQYMAMGMPVVASPVGVNSEIIEDGVNGFLANTHDEWFQKLSTLIENERLRREMGIAGRKKVEAMYSLDNTVKKLIAILSNAGQISFG